MSNATTPESTSQPISDNPSATGVAIVDITEAAAKKARAVLEEVGGRGIRIAVVGGGCAGLQYDLQPAETPAENDIVLEFYGTPFFVSPMVVPYLKGTRIDYVNSLMEGGFKFMNPNAASSCGCGSSFGV